MKLLKVLLVVWLTASSLIFPEGVKAMLTDLSLYPLKKGIYQHYRNKKYYEVLGIARHSETLEPLVVYRALYDAQDLWVRPYAMFVEHLHEQSYEGPRFIYISEQSAEDFFQH